MGKNGGKGFGGWAEERGLTGGWLLILPCRLKTFKARFILTKKKKYLYIDNLLTVKKSWLKKNIEAHLVTELYDADLKVQGTHMACVSCFKRVLCDGPPISFTSLLLLYLFFKRERIQTLQ